MYLLYELLIFNDDVSQHNIQCLSRFDLQILARLINHLKNLRYQFFLSLNIAFEHISTVSENVALLVVLRFLEQHQASLYFGEVFVDRQSFDFIFGKSLLHLINILFNLLILVLIERPLAAVGTATLAIAASRAASLNATSLNADIILSIAGAGQLLAHC